MAANTVVDSGDADAVAGIPRGNHLAAVKTGGNALYQVWDIPGRKPKWQARVISRFHAAQATDLPPPVPGARLVMTLRQDDLLYMPQVEGDKIFVVKKMVHDGRIHIWPLRYAVSERDIEKIRERFPMISLTFQHYWTFSSADSLRKAGVCPATISILGRLRVKRI